MQPLACNHRAAAQTAVSIPERVGALSVSPLCRPEGTRDADGLYPRSGSWPPHGQIAQQTNRLARSEYLYRNTAAAIFHLFLINIYFTSTIANTSRPRGIMVFNSYRRT